MVYVPYLFSCTSISSRPRIVAACMCEHNWVPGMAWFYSLFLDHIISRLFENWSWKTSLLCQCLQEVLLKINKSRTPARLKLIVAAGSIRINMVVLILYYSYSTNAYMVLCARSCRVTTNLYFAVEIVSVNKNAPLLLYAVTGDIMNRALYPVHCICRSSCSNVCLLMTLTYTSCVHEQKAHGPG